MKLRFVDIFVPNNMMPQWMPYKKDEHGNWIPHSQCAFDSYQEALDYCSSWRNESNEKFKIELYFIVL